MKKHLIIAASILLGSFLPAHADDKEDVAKAIKSLTEKANYSWISTSKRPEGAGGGGGAGGRGGAPSPTSGKAVGDLIYMTSTRGDRTSESLVKGNKAATKGQDGWATVEARTPGDAGGGRQRGGGGGGRNLLNFKSPAVQAGELLATVAELNKDGDAYTGDLTAEAAKAMVSFGGRGGRGSGGNAGAARPEPTGVKASAKFWITDGVLTKYENVTAGSISFNGNDRDLGRTTTVEIKDVGTTKIDAPEEATKLVAE
jgi:hypothetical protein